ncbi:MAG TPA: hypothetical protein VKU61_09290 [Candidatus Binatia bacterium]|nr:hypothetical protein [Candidatus Binatia bacterium]
MFSRMPSRRPRERGIALAVALFGIALLSIVLAASLLVGSSDARATRAYKRTSQVHLVAESGILHAVQVANRSAGIGVENYQNDVYNNWATLWTPSTKTFSGLSGFSYAVVAGSGNANGGYFKSTATGPEGSTNTVVASVSRSVIPSTAPGALHLANAGATDCNFTGNAFSISGNDMNYTGGVGPGAPVPGISTLNNTNTQEAITSLNNNQDHDVTGLGYSANPLIPSVATSPGAPTAGQINAMVADLLAEPGVVTQGSGTVNNSSSIPGWQCKNNDPAPTPEITHFTGDVTFKGNGNITGQGILIVDGNLTLNGKITFDGLIIVRGQTNVTSDTDVTGNASIWGSLWTTDINMVVGGSAFIQYSTQALALANQIGPGHNLPSKLVINSMVDCAEVPAGTNNC